jgi:hypothetical protein
LAGKFQKVLGHRFLALALNALTPSPSPEGRGEKLIKRLHRRGGHGLHGERPGHTHLPAVHERLVVERLLRGVVDDGLVHLLPHGAAGGMEGFERLAGRLRPVIRELKLTLTT